MSRYIHFSVRYRAPFGCVLPGALLFGGSDRMGSSDSNAFLFHLDSGMSSHLTARREATRNKTTRMQRSFSLLLKGRGVIEESAVTDRYFSVRLNRKWGPVYNRKRTTLRKRRQVLIFSGKSHFAVEILGDPATETYFPLLYSIQQS